MRDKIINSFDIWITAQGLKSRLRIKNTDNISLEGITRLRELILELAVRGKLVPQDSKDESADLLLERIAIERQQSIKDREIKKHKPLPEISEEEKSHELPKGWIWAKLGNIGETNIGLTYSPKDVSDTGMPVLRSSNIQDGQITLSDLVRVRAKVAEKNFVESGDIVICARNGSRKLVGKCAIIPAFNERMSFGAFMAIFRSKINFYIKYFLESPYYRGRLERVATTTINQITQDNLKNTVIPLPPLQEQHRIVAKVDELMSLCDKLEQQETNHLKSHQLLVQTLLGTLTNAADANEFQTAWNRLEQHFDDLFTTEDSIDQLKQTILQLAVMGKLVPQDPKDEPASVLLKKIEIEKERLIKKDLIKQEKPLPAISEDEIPYRLPFGWQWCRMKDLCPNISSGSTPPKEYFKDSGIPYLKVYNIRAQQIDFEYQEQFVDEKYHRTKLSRSILRPGDVIMNIVGPPLGKVAIIPDSYPEWNCNQAITFFQPLEESVNKWIYTFLLAGTFLNYIELIGTAGQDNISVTKSKMIMVPLPPISEQFRIVQKVNELFALCDRLKEGIGESQKVVTLMAKSIVEQV